jgi:hypothetical protein
LPFSNSNTFQAVDSAFPGSKVILAIRDEAEQWFVPLIRFHTTLVNNGRLPTAEDLPSFDFRHTGYLWDAIAMKCSGALRLLQDRDACMANHVLHIRIVTDYVRHRPLDLLVQNVGRPGSMQRPCGFLGVSYSGRSMPDLNRTNQSLLTLSEGIGDQGEMDKRGEHHVERLEAGEDPTKALQAAEQPLDVVAPLVDCLAVVPGGESIGLRRNHRGETQIESPLAGLVALVGAVHDQVQAPVRAAQRGQQLAAFGRVVRLARRQRERYGRSSIRGNQMNLGGPSAAGLADRLRAVFLSAPVPSGCTLTTALSRATDSILMRTI